MDAVKYTVFRTNYSFDLVYLKNTLCIIFFLKHSCATAYPIKGAQHEHAEYALGSFVLIENDFIRLYHALKIVRHFFCFMKIIMKKKTSRNLATAEVNRD